MRYKGPLYLDRCGLVLRELEQKYPGMSQQGFDPNGATIRIPDRATTIKMGMSMVNLTEDFPASTSSMCEVADFLVASVIRTFEIELFERVGARFVFVLPVEQLSEADSLLLETGIIAVPERKRRLFGDQVADIGAKFVIQDDEQGFIFNLASGTREINIDVPRPITIDDRKIARRILLVDVDRFTRKPVGIGTLSASDFIRTAYRTIENNLNTLLRPGTT